MEWEASLNPAQREAVKHIDGPLLVLAGPGSGKTRVITQRIAHLIAAGGIPHYHILAVTFTNKAADEMRRRVEAVVAGKPPLVTTFHKFCARVIREHASLLGFDPNFTILDQSERRQVLSRLVKDQGLDTTHFSPAAIEHRISNAKNRLETPEEFGDKYQEYFDRLVAQIYPLYQERMKELNALDFDDLLYFVADLLRRDPEVRAKLDRRYRYILVDEYQDTNLAQYAITRALSVDAPNVCVTGDPDQSIYSWRGATIENILSFEKDFPSATVVRLEQNYRSTKHILKVADHLIRKNQQRKHKELVTDNPAGAKVRVLCYQDDLAEAQGIADEIRGRISRGERRLGDFAIFVRTNNLTRSIEAALRARGIAYQIVGGMSFFERREIKDILAYARTLLNPKDDVACRRIINTPARGIGATTISRIEQFAMEHGLSLIEACLDPHVPQLAKGKIRAALSRFAELMTGLRAVVALPPDAAIEGLVEETGYREYLEAQEDEDREDRLAHLADLHAEAQSFAEANPDTTLIDFLETVSLASDGDKRDEQANLATVMTLHAAKGLEFPVVYMMAFEENILPHQRAVEEGQIEEERRLAFVGITRAREELTLSYTQRRSFQGRTDYAEPSLFLHELPKGALAREDRVVNDVEAEDPFPDFDIEPEFEEPSIQVVRRPRRGGSSKSDQFRTAMQVQHPEYGEGTVISLEGTGDRCRALVLFPDHGAKMFLLAESDLQPVAISR